jgi:PAS domain S-box-containing protein
MSSSIPKRGPHGSPKKWVDRPLRPAVTTVGEMKEGGWEQLFRTVFERSSSPCILLDERQRVIELNQPALALLDRSRLELIGTSFLDTIAAAERGRAAREWYGLLRTGAAVGTHHLARRDDSEMQVEFAASLTRIRGRLVALYVVSVAARLPQPVRRGALAAPLTEREREVATLIALGHETVQIAADLHIAPETVKSHVRNAMTKLNVHTRAQLVAVALCSGQIVYVPHLEEESADNPPGAGWSARVA